MFWRLISSAASLAVALAGATAIDCVDEFSGLISGEPVGICAAVDAIGADPGLLVGIGLVALGLMALVAIWVRPHVREQRLQPESSLKHNLSRLPDSSPEEEEEPLAILETNARHLTRRLEILEAALEADTIPTREVTQQWMTLLRDANYLHNSDEVSTEDFKRINTRLLELFTAPADRKKEDLAATS